MSLQGFSGQVASLPLPIIRELHRLERDAFQPDAPVPIFTESMPCEAFALRRDAQYIVNSQNRPMIGARPNRAANFCLIAAAMMVAMMLGGIALALIEGRL